MGSASPSRAIDELFSRVDSARVRPAAASHESSVFRRFQCVLSGISFALKRDGSAERLASKWSARLSAERPGGATMLKKICASAAVLIVTATAALANPTQPN